MELRFKYNKLIIQAFLDADNANKKSLIFSPGLPHYLTKYHPMIKELTELGYNVFVPNYYGSYDSAGLFSLKNSIKSINHCIAFVKQGEAAELFNNKIIKWNNEKILVAGFSFGALPALANIKIINELILLMPFVNNNMHNKGRGENLYKTLNFIKRAFPLTYKFNINKISSELKKFNYENLIKKNKTPIILVYGLKDKNIPKEEIKWIKNNFNIKNEISLDIEHSCNLGKENWLKIFKK